MRTTHTLNVHFWLKKVSIKNDGTIPIYARIWIDSSPVDISTKEAVLEEHWNLERARVKSRTKYAKVINNALDDIQAKIKIAYKQLIEEGRVISAKAVKSRFLGKDKAVLTLNDIVRYHREHELKKLAKGTAKNYAATEKYLNRFIKEVYKTEDLLLTNVDYSFIVNFDNYLRNCTPLVKSQPLKNNGIMKHMERLQKFMTLATNHGWIKVHPFASYKLKFEAYDCPFLDQKELNAIKNLEIEKPGMRLVRDVFVFSCYTGLSYIDVKQLTVQNIVTGIDEEQWLNLRRQKSRIATKIPLLDEAKAILDTYVNYPNNQNNFALLPVYSDQKMNKYLKVIAKSCGVEKNITFHVARHTFATTVALLNQVPIETVSKLLGHTKLSTTQRYARVVEKKISQDMNKLRLKLKSKSKKNSKHKEIKKGHLRIV
ncbi:site-specific integrase [Tamlana fucoidanivorans]|uniref:Site-specific integrase n=1 Tax=Allotamlana fucoidanivorans TaxID=2583814 RepID=A0A5C4SPG2_9FLAO|nr:site-specific integrase [Tamlana fucoidanivorans]TNJ46101.1 site-specific integrase [Tamlana fucoidanivorans]